MLERLPEGRRSASLTLTTDNGTQFTSSRFLETWHDSASRIAAPRIITRKATATSNGSTAA